MVESDYQVFIILYESCILSILHMHVSNLFSMFNDDLHIVISILGVKNAILFSFETLLKKMHQNRNSMFTVYFGTQINNPYSVQCKLKVP